MKFFFLFILTFSAWASAGIRTGGNGGGFGEMKALLAWEDLERSLALCLTQANICGLSATETAVIKNVLMTMPQEKSSGGLQFFNDPSLRRKVETENRVGSKIFINSSLLTAASGQIQSTGQIAAWVLWGILQHQQKENAQMSLLHLAQKIFSSLSDEVQTAKVSIDNSSILLHRLKISRGTYGNLGTEKIVLEDRVHSYDLFSVTGIETSCRNRSALYRIRSINLTQFNKQILVHLDWSCDGISWGQAAVTASLEVIPQTQTLKWPLRFEIKGLIKPSSGV